MYHPKTDVTHRYRETPADFVKHLSSTLIVIIILTVLLSALFGEPVRPTLKISHLAYSDPILFEQTALSNLNGQSSISGYGPPYNPGTAQSYLQELGGIIHPVNPRVDLFLRPLRMAAKLNSVLQTALGLWNRATPAQQTGWENSYSQSLSHAVTRGNNVILPPGNYGPLATMMRGMLNLGRSGLMVGALDHSPADYQFNNQNSLLFLEDAPLHTAAAKLALQGDQWGIIHEEQIHYPGPWWMTIVTAIYQIPYIANSPSGDALALSLGLLIFILLLVAPWIPVLNRLPRYLGVHKLIWYRYYSEHRSDFRGDSTRHPRP